MVRVESGAANAAPPSAIGRRLPPFGGRLLRVGQGRRGQSLVEFALAIPIFLIVVCGALEFSFLLADQIMLNNAARDAARSGSVPAGDSWSNRQTRTIACAAGTGSAPCNHSSTQSLVSCTVGTNTATATYGDINNPSIATQVTSQVGCTYTPITPLGSLVSMFWGGGTVSLTARSTKMVEP